MAENPFGDDAGPDPKRDPFGDEVLEDPVAEGANRTEHAARKIRMLRSRLGAEGLTPSATRELLDEMTKSMDAVAAALRTLGKER